MLNDWIRHSLTLARTEADFYSGARKIIRGRSLLFRHVEDDLTLADCGFTKSKQSMLVRNYLNAESRDAAVKLWERRVEQEKYGSVGFSCYNHLVKGGGLRNPWERAAKFTGIKPTPGGVMGGRRRKDEAPRAQPKVSRASVMGPCIQALTLTLLKKNEVAIDLFYRTTELFKKFPADLVFIRDVLLEPFDLKDIKEMRFHFANITLHPMYFVTIIPHLDDPIAELERIRKEDKYFFDWAVKWSARYLCKEHNRGISKFAQALRVQKDALERITGSNRRDIVKYLNKHHPGYRNAYVAPEEEDDV
jgi:hypothetical protein